MTVDEAVKLEKILRTGDIVDFRAWCTTASFEAVLAAAHAAAADHQPAIFDHAVAVLKEMPENA